MATTLWPSDNPGPTNWTVTRDAEGHREYKIMFQVKADSQFVGPNEVLNTAGLPQVGDQWALGDDADEFAWCLPTAKASPRLTKEANYFWDTEHTFSTKPPAADKQRCNDTQIEDPLLEPQKISGSFTETKWEASTNRFGVPITTSSWEQIRGPQVEFDITKPTVKIEQNVPVLALPVLARMGNTVNAFPLWGMAPRHIKLSKISYERKFFGKCSVYFTRSLEFDIDTSTAGFDRDVLDEGTKVLNGHWDATTGEWVLDNIDGAAPDPTNPKHFIRFKDKNGENARVVLNGAGLPAGVVTASGNFFVLYVEASTGVPPPNPGIWKQLSEPSFDLWDGSVTYHTGDVVITNADQIYWIALSSNTSQFPTAGSAFWQALGSSFVYQGTYDNATNYNSGDVVESLTSTEAGKRHIEFYDESDFLLLGIPADLETPT